MSKSAFRSLAVVGALIVGAAVLPSSLMAQHSASMDSASMSATVATVVISPATDTTNRVNAAGPRVAPAGIVAAARPGLAEMQNRNDNVGMGSNLALMGVGAAGVVIGLLVGGDGGAAIAIGGGVLGLIGLYRYLR